MESGRASCGACKPVAATDDLSSQRFYHGTKADLKPGDLIEPGHPPDSGERDRVTTYVYLTGTLDAAAWEAELAPGEGPGRIYIVEPTGPIEDDPDLTDKKYPGPTKSYRSRRSAPGHGRVHGFAGAPAALLPWHEGRPEARGPDRAGPFP